MFHERAKNNVHSCCLLRMPHNSTFTVSKTLQCNVHRKTIRVSLFRSYPAILKLGQILFFRFFFTFFHFHTLISNLITYCA